MSELALNIVNDVFLERLAQGEVRISNRHRAAFRVHAGSRWLTKYGEGVVADFRQLLEELAALVLQAGGNDVQYAIDAYSTLIKEQRFSGISQVLDEIGQERNYAQAASEFFRLRAFWLEQNADPFLAPAILRMVRGECRTISDRLTRWIISHRPAEGRVAGANGYHFHTASTCSHNANRAQTTVVEHTIPLNLIHDRILGFPTACDKVHDDSLDTAERIELFLRRHMVISHLTTAEDGAIIPRLKRNMPQKWKWRCGHADSPLRYRDVGRYFRAGFEFFVAGDPRCPHCSEHVRRRMQA